MSQGLESNKEGIVVLPVLFLAADPNNTSRSRLGKEFRTIDEQLRLAEHRDHLRLTLPQLSLRPSDITGALLNERPRIVHFSGHGTPEGALYFENEHGQAYLVQPAAIAILFEQFANVVKCVVLNACYSVSQAEAIARHIEYVIGMNREIGDQAAIAFAIGFYQALGAGRTIEEAFAFGGVQIQLRNIPEHLTPVLIKRQLQPLSGSMELPRVLHFFVGRDKELGQIRNDLRSGYTVQIRGLGGTGKSTLAIKAADAMRDSFPDGIVWLFAPEYETMELLLNGLIQYFDIEIGQMSLNDKKVYIQRMLAKKKAMLVLDNVENTTVVEEIMTLLPRIPILITSRPHINLIRDARWVVLGELQPREAVELFLKISSRSFSQREHEIIENICSKLGFFPLAIVLAAKLFRFSYPNLNDLSQVVGDAINNMPESIDDRSVSASFHTTYQTLSSKEQKLFAALGVFPGRTFSYEAITFIAQNLKPEEVREILHNKFVPLSLVKYEEGRYSLHPLLKTFACENLFSTEPYTKMAEYFATYADNNKRNFSLLEAERANLFGAIDWGVKNDKYEVVVALVEALVGELSYFSFLSQRGYWNEAIQRLEQEVKAIQKTSSVGDTGKIHRSLGLFHYYLGNHYEAREAHQSAKKEFELTNDIEGLIIAYWQSGYIEDDEDNYDEALALYNKSLELAGHSDEYQHYVLNSRKLVGVVKYHMGDYEGARADMEQSLREAEARDNKPDISTCKRRLAAVIRRQAALAPDERERQDLLEKSRQLLDDCLRIEMHLRSIARIQRQLGLVELAVGNIGEAEKWFEYSLDLFKKIGNRKGIASALYNSGTILQEQNRLEDARQLYYESLKIAEQLNVRLGIARNLSKLALIEYKYGNDRQAMQLKTKAINILKTIRSPYLQETLAMMSDMHSDKDNFEQHEFNKIYDRLWKGAMESFEEGCVEIDSYLLDLNNDKRRGLSIVAIPDNAVVQEFRFLIDTLRRVEPDQYFYSPDQFHVTVLSLFPATENYGPFFEKISKYQEVIRPILLKSDSFSIIFRGITASKGAVMARGYTQGSFSNMLRTQLIDALRKSGLDEGLDFRYPRSTAHSTLMRFKKQPVNFGLLIDTLKRFRNFRFGRANILTLRFVEHDWYSLPDKTRVLEEYPLGTN